MSASATASQDPPRTRWEGMTAEQRRAEMAPATEARRRKSARREAIQAASDDYTGEAFTCAMGLVAELRSTDPERRRAALEVYSSRLIVAALDLDAALVRIDAAEGTP